MHGCITIVDRLRLEAAMIVIVTSISFDLIVMYLWPSSDSK